MLVLFAVPALSLLFLQNRQVQTMVSKYVAERLSEELQASISLSSVNYSFFKRIQVRDLYIEDLNGDTLLYSELTKLRIRQFKPDRKRIEIRKITLENAHVNLVIDSSRVVNLAFIIDRIKKPHVPPERKSLLIISSIELIDSRFSLSKMERIDVESGVNFTDLHLNDLQISVENLISALDTVHFDITRLEGTEVSGFRIGSLNSHMSLSKRHLHFYNTGIQTEESDLHIPDLRFDFGTYRDFRNFSRKVDLGFTSDQSDLNLNDLAYFVPGLQGRLERIILDGNISGKLNNMSGEDLIVTFGDYSALAFDFVMIGLPDFKSTFMDFNFRELNTSVLALNSFLGQGQDSLKQVLYPWDNLGNLDFNGRFTGYPDQFVASGLLATDLGRMVLDLSFSPDSILGIDFNGRLRTRDFMLGRFLEQESIVSGLDMNILADGNLYRGNIEAQLSGTIDTLELYEYAYSNITLDGEFTNTTFNGGFSVSDPNIRMDFLGRMDFSGEVPEYNFTADVGRARPYFLNLGTEDPNSFASFLIETNVTGNRIDDLNGEIKLVNSLFENQDGQVQLYDVSLSAIKSQDSSKLEIRSDMLNARLEGNYQLSTLPASLRDMADRFLNVVPDYEPGTDSVNNFTYQVNFQRINPLLDFFYPKLQIGEGSQLQGTYHPEKEVFTNVGFFPEIEFADNHWTNMDLFSEITGGEFQFYSQSDSMTYGEGYSLIDQKLQFLAGNDTADLGITWDNRIGPKYSGEIKLSGAFQPDSLVNRGFLVGVHPTVIRINDDPWTIDTSTLLLKKGFLNIDSLQITSEARHVLAHGTISREEERDFHMELKNLNMSQLSNFTGLNLDLEGNITGTISYQLVEGLPQIFADLSIDTLVFNQQMLGATKLNAGWNDSRKTISMNLLSDLDGTRMIDVDGSYSPDGEKLDFNVRLQEFALNTLSPYAESIVKNLQGTGNINMTLDGTLPAPKLNGNISFNDGSATLSFLNTRYEFNDQIRVYNNNFYLEDFLIIDEEGNTAFVDGSISNTNLKNFYTSLNINADNLKCMNTRASDNEIFYGTIYATGNVGIRGQSNNYKLEIDAATERNTRVYLPLYNASEVQNSDFITFVLDKEFEEVTNNGQAKKIGGLEMELEVNVTRDAKVQLIFDPEVGDIIETSGSGNLRMLFNPGNGFSMFGDVELQSGEYLFTLQNVINKRFQIEPGGKITFNGSPTNAVIDLNAIYTTRTAPYNLYPGDGNDAQESLKRRIPVECHLNLLGELQSPSISTDIQMPTADPETRDLLENSTSTEEELMKQFLSLLVINNFYSVSGLGAQSVGTMNSSFAGVTASELLSNQLSNWLSQISDDFDIGVNYRPGDQISSDEVEVALSTQLLNDRIIISGNVDVGGQETNPSIETANPYIVGDFDLEFKVTDNVSVLAFNRARDELLFDTAPYKQGVGISYREEFDDLNHLISRYKEGLSNRKKKRKKTKKPKMDE